MASSFTPEMRLHETTRSLHRPRSACLSTRVYGRRAVLLTLLLAGCPKSSDRPAGEQPPAPASQPASQPAAVPDLKVELSETSSLSAERLRAHVSHLASDALEGRGPATKGIHAVAEYLEKELRAIGAKPAFGASYRQPFEMT